MRKFFYGASALGLTAYAGSYYFFPEVRKNQYQLYKAVERATRLAKTGVQMAYIYKSEGDIHEKHVKASSILYECFKKNAGVYIKFGQILATLDVIVPQEYLTVMANLYQSAPTSDFQEVKYMLESTTGKKLEDMFAYFDNKPLSSASIAQVHEARLKSGERVAVKIQHNWLKEQCDGDIRLVTFGVLLGEKFFPEFKYKWFAEELQKNIPKELDFNQEAKNAERMIKIFANVPNVKIPKIYREFSNDKVLVMEFIEGVAINEIQKMKQMGLNLGDVAKILGESFAKQIFHHGYVHGDPHPGNIFVSKMKGRNGETKPELILLDHGLYTELDESTRLQYSYLWKGIFTQNEKLIKEASEKLGVIEFWPLFAAMVVSKTYDHIMTSKEKDVHHRLKPLGTPEEKEQLQGLARQFAKEITIVLHNCNRDLVLLFKVNDFLKTLYNQLGSPVKHYEIIAQNCFDAIEKAESKMHKGIWQRLRFLYEKLRIRCGMILYSYLLSIKSLFMPNVSIE